MASFTTNAKFKIAAMLAEKRIQYADRRLPPPTKLEGGILRFCLSLLGSVIRDIPNSWSSMFLAGKIHERLGEHAKSYAMFKESLIHNPVNFLLLNEASLAALHLGRSEEALSISSRALDIEPDNPGALADHALALLLAGRLDEAQSFAQRSLRLTPGDAITCNLARVIEAVASTGAPCPASMSELQQFARRVHIPRT